MDKIKFIVGGKTVEVEREQLDQMLEKGEVNVPVDGLVIRTSEEEETFKTNLAKVKYDDGKKAGAEMVIKEGREAFGLEFEGKTIQNFGEALKSKALTEAKIEPDKRIKELEGDVETLRGNLKTVQGTFDSYKEQVIAEKTRGKKDTFLLGLIPDQGLRVSKSITLSALKTEGGIDIDYTEEGTPFVTVNGVAQKNDTDLTYTNPKIFIGEKITEMGLIDKPGGGGGGGDDTGGGGTPGSYDAFVKEMLGKDIHEGSLEFSEEMNKRINDKTLTM